MFLDIQKSQDELNMTELYDYTGNSVIHKAASLGHAEVLMLLLERTGAKPAMVNSSLATPLHLACGNGHLEVARLLLDCGVDTTAVNNGGYTPLHYACEFRHHEVAELLRQHGAVDS